jgi:Fic family protein
MKLPEINIDNITYDIKILLNRLTEKLAYLNDNRPLSSGVVNRLREELNLEWNYNSNAIEGNTLTLIETKVILEDGITVGGKTLREHFEVINHKKAIDEVYALANKDYTFRAIDILTLHSIVLENIDSSIAGRIRSGNVRIVGAQFTPPNASKVSDLFDELIEYVNDKKLKLHPIIIASIFHHLFVWIHPFFDGNGRICRLITNLYLMKHGYPPAIILTNDRKKYYSALRQADAGNYSKLILIIAQAVERIIHMYESALTNNNDDYFDTINNIVSESDFEYGTEYISLLARKGKIAAHKEGKNWYTSKNAIASYIENKRK